MEDSQHFESLYPAETRSKEIEQILNYIKQGNSCQIIGLPGVGRATVLRLLAYNRKVRIKHLGENQKNYHFVLANMSEIRRRPLVDVIKYLFLSLVDSLHDRGILEAYEKTYAIFKDVIVLNDELVLFQGLKQAVDLLVFDKKLTIVFLFDRFEEHIPVLEDDFFANLRVLRNRAKFQFSAIFSVSRPLEDLIEPALMAEYFDYVAGNIIYLSPSDAPGVDFRVSHLEKLTAKKLDPEKRKIIYTATAGIARLVKTASELILSPNEQISNEDLETFLYKSKGFQKALSDIWRSLNPSEQDFLLSNSDYSSSDLDYPYLANVGLLKNNKITIPLFKRYLEDITPIEQQTKNEAIVYDPNTNEIKQGNDILSDNLTSAEYKLLSFLIQNAGSIVDREAIINAVWKDTVSTAGVTDQALDQLLFRVRRKIEDDPNNPTHIQTVKGRGIRFTA